jgi:hypothetical protein
VITAVMFVYLKARAAFVDIIETLNPLTRSFVVSEGRVASSQASRL